MLPEYCYDNIFLSFRIRTMYIYSLPHLIFYLNQTTTNKNNQNNGDTNLGVEGFLVDRGMSAIWYYERAMMIAMEFAKKCCFRNKIIIKK